jgi:hypothetical protein
MRGGDTHFVGPLRNRKPQSNLDLGMQDDGKSPETQ